MTAEELSKLREAIGLLDSMVRCGEKHSEKSEKVVADARAVLRAHP